MWWEIVPPFAIMVCLTYAPHVLVSLEHKLLFNTPYKRNMEKDHDWYMFQRDRSHAYSTFWTRLHGHKISEGDPYRSHGLEAIPDKK